MELFRLLGRIVVDSTEANKEIDTTVGNAKKKALPCKAIWQRWGKVAVGIAGTITTVATAVSGFLIGLADNTREYRTEMGKLDAAFTANGHSSEEARSTYKALQSVLGDTEQAVEAANHLSLLTSNEQELKTWTDICTGVFATFGNSLPIEGLTESANETAKVGKVTGTLADALNWAGISEKEFNNDLSACTSEQERQRLIMDTLNGTYKTASDRYKTMNKDIIASNTAHDNLNAAMAGLGAAAEPAVTVIVNACAKLAEKATPVVEALSNAVLWLAEAWQDLKRTMTDITARITVHTNNINAAVESVGAAVTEKTGSATLGAHSELIVQTSMKNPDSNYDAGAIINGIKTFFGWGKTDGVNASGLRYVPFDGFRSLLHEGEIVLPRHEADEYRSGKSSGMDTAELKAEIRALSDRVAGFMQQIAANTASGHQVVLDTGALVGRLAPRIDAELGAITMHKMRDNL